MTPTVLGLDGGGSQTRCRLVNAQGTVLGQGEAPASNYHAVGGEAAYHAILSAIAAATANQTVVIRAITLGLAGGWADLGISRWFRIGSSSYNRIAAFL